MILQNACAIVGSRRYYANALLIGVSASNIKKLQQVQNTLVHIVTRQFSYAGTSQSFATLHWFIFKWRIDFKVATISYKLLLTRQSSSLASSISRHAPGHSLRSSDSGSLYVPRTKLVTGEHALRSSASSIWNCLPADIRNSGSMQLFRNKLKTHFFHLAFN